MVNIRPLTARQSRFVETYLVCFNATQAAKDAGYSTRNLGVGARLMRTPAVAAAVTARAATAGAKFRVTSEWVMGELVKDVHSADRQARSTALGLLTKCLGMQLDRHHHTGSLTLEELLIKARDRRESESDGVH